jgi:endoglucanase
VPHEQMTPPDAPEGVRADTARGADRRRTRTGAVALAVLLLAVAAVVRYQDDVRRAVETVAADQPIVASDRTLLSDLWRAYKDRYLEEGTRRTLDLQADDITTSEGQSYTMLRAVWMDDQETFADSWQWTKDNLQRGDSLMAWKFGELPDGSYGIQTHVGGGNTATDADVDIAFALLMAYSRWKDDDHLYDALPIIESIWEKDVVRVGDRWVLAANDLERIGADGIVVNPSYLAPYAYRVFAQVDEDHDWAGLVDDSYALLADLQDQPLDAGSAAGLPPNWVSVDRRTGELGAPAGELTTRFGYDALRLPWRLALDHRWYGDPRALRLLEGQDLLAREWADEHRLAAEYDRDGTPAADYEAPAMYGAVMGFFDVVRPELADEVYAEKLLPHYDVDDRDVAGNLGYYDSNWVWFGMALHLDQLPNLNVIQE